MSFTRIKAILLQEFFITRRALEVIIDTIFFSLISVVVFGYIFVFLTKGINALGGMYIILGMLLWEVIRIAQYSMSVGSLWNVWSRNLSNMFIAPLTTAEYLIAQMLSSLIKTLAIFILMTLVAHWVFKFNILSLGLGNLFLYFINLVIFSWWTGLIILGLIFRFGTRIQALAWGLIFLFQPLTAVFFPLSILPVSLQKVALLFPATYIFEAARANLVSSSLNWNLVGLAFLENVIYFIFSLWLFNVLFKKSKQSGQFARNEQ